MRNALVYAGLASAVFAAPAVRAEGSAQVGDNQALNPATLIEVDLTAGEVLHIAARPYTMAPYPGQVPSGPLSVTISPYGQSSTTHSLVAGAGRWPDGTATAPTTIVDAFTYVAQTSGTHVVQFSQYVLPWDVSVTAHINDPVLPEAPQGGRGRVYSREWAFNAGTFSSAGATDADFYVVTPGGTLGSNFVWLLDFEGLAGYVFQVAGNGLGLDAPHERTSMPGSSGASFEPEHDVYLTLPSTALGSQVPPSVVFQGVSGSGLTLEGQGGTFRFASNVTGTYEIIIDTDLDGFFDPQSSDARLAGSCVAGSNDAVWDGNDANGTPVPASVTPYDAKLYLRIGEFHFAGWDIETARPGLAVQSVDPSFGQLSSTFLYWDDRAVLTGNPVDDPSPAQALSGVDSSVQRHAWGGFHGGGPGNMSYIDTWVFGQESSDVHQIEIQSPNGDADGDGVTNDFDSHPCDANKQSVVYMPSETGFGQLMFEDNWPRRGDLDFNDLVLGYHYEFVLGPNGGVAGLEATYDALAIGAGIRSGIAVRLPVSSSQVQSVERRVGSAPLQSSGFTPDGTDTIFTVAVDGRDLFASPPPMVNTMENLAVVDGETVTLSLSFAQEIPASVLDVADAPFDVFIFRVGDPTHEIHQPRYGGTTAMNTALFNTESDGSSATRHFVTTNGLPFVLDVPNATSYPLEKVLIEDLYPDIVTFAATAGASASNYHQSTLNSAFAFLYGFAQQTLVPPSLGVSTTVVGGTSCGP